MLGEVKSLKPPELDVKSHCINETIPHIWILVLCESFFFFTLKPQFKSSWSSNVKIKKIIWYKNCNNIELQSRPFTCCVKPHTYTLRTNDNKLARKPIFPVANQDEWQGWEDESYCHSRLPSPVTADVVPSSHWADDKGTRGAKSGGRCGKG